jgi:hypothetical protein
LGTEIDIKLDKIRTLTHMIVEFSIVHTFWWQSCRYNSIQNRTSENKLCVDIVMHTVHI